MTQPTDPQTPPATVTDPATPPAAPPAAPPAVPAEPSTPPAADDTPWADPVKAQAEIERLRSENAKARTNAKATAAEEARKALAGEIAKILDPNSSDTPPDPAQLTQQLTTTAAEAKQAKLELAVFRAAADSGANASALLDSRSFLAAVDSLDATDTAGITTAIQAAVQKDPRLKATPGAAPVGGAPQVGGGSAPARTYTREQLRDPEFFATNRADILRAQREGRIRE